MAECTKCNSLNVEVTDDGNLTCLECGSILEETDHLQAEVALVTTESGTRACGGVVSGVSNGTSMATSVPRAAGKGPRPAAFLCALQSPTLRHIDTIGTKLGLQQPVMDRAKFLCQHLNQSEKYCRSPVMLAAALVYIALREKDKPFTMYEFAPYLPHNDVFGMGRVYTKILSANTSEDKDKGLISPLKDVDPAVYVERVCSSIKGAEEPMKNSIKNLTLRILCFTHSCWITTGRRHEAISMGAISLAMEALEVNRECLNSLCGLLKVSLNTAKVRVRELKVLLLDKAKTLIPWASAYNERTIHKVLVKLLDQLDTLTRLLDKNKQAKQADAASSSPTSPSTPPSSESSSTPESVPTSSPSSSSSSSSLSSSTSALVPTCNNPNNNNNNNISLQSSADNFPKANIATLPPSFISSMAARERRALKLANAKRRLIATFEKQPELLKTLSPNLQASLAAFPRNQVVPTSPALPPPTIEAYPLAPRYKSPSPQTPPPTSPCASPGTPSPPISPLTLSPYSSPSCSPNTPPASPSTQAYFHPPPTQPPPKSGRRQSKSKAVYVTPQVLERNYDHEDLIIEKLLLKGVNEDLILSGYYDAQTAETVTPVVHPNLASEKIGEDDIPDSEMDKFIRSPEEVKVFTQMSSGWGDEDGNMDHKPIGKRRKRSYKAEDTNGGLLADSLASGAKEAEDLQKKPRMAN